MNLDQARFFMVEQQIRPWDVLDSQILDLLMETPRHNFVEESQIPLAYSDIELPIGHGEVMMSPKVEGKLLQALAIQADEKALEVGTGSGFVTAILAQLAKEVTTVEIIPALQKTAMERLKDFANINFQTGDASSDWNDNQYYDAILFTGSLPEVPEAYKEKLSIGGRMAVITGNSPAMTATLITRTNQDEWQEEFLFETVLPALKNAKVTPTFSL